MQKLTYFGDSNAVKFAPIQSDTIGVAALAANTNKAVAIPAGARFVRMSLGAQFYYNPNNAAATIAGADAATGGSVTVTPYENPLICVDGLTNLNFIAPAAGVLSLEWFA